MAVVTIIANDAPHISVARSFEAEFLGGSPGHGTATSFSVTMDLGRVGAVETCYRERAGLLRRAVSEGGR